MESGLASGAYVAERYRLRYLLGRGGFGEVWLAGDESTTPPRQVALKLLLLAREAQVDARRRERFAREASILMRVEHPSVVRALDVGEHGEHTYLALEYIDGVTLGADLQQHAQSGTTYAATEVDTIVRELAEGLHAAHELGIVHRDLKPLNVMLARDGAVKILDFGIAKLLDLDPLEETTLGRRIGSLLYLSPEQALGLRVDRRSDVFVLASIAFEMLTLERPWTIAANDRPLSVAQALVGIDANAPAALLHRIVDGARPSVGRARMGGDALDAVLHRAWATRMEARFESTRALADALHEALAEAARGEERRGDGEAVSGRGDAEAARAARSTAAAAGEPSGRPIPGRAGGDEAARGVSALLAAARLPVEGGEVVRTIARPGSDEGATRVTEVSLAGRDGDPRAAGASPHEVAAELGSGVAASPSPARDLRRRPSTPASASRTTPSRARDAGRAADRTGRRPRWIGALTVGGLLVLGGVGIARMAGPAPESREEARVEAGPPAGLGEATPPPIARPAVASATITLVRATAAPSVAPPPRERAPQPSRSAARTPSPRASERGRPSLTVERPVQRLRRQLASDAQMLAPVAREASELLARVPDLGERRSIERALEAGQITGDAAALDRALARLDAALP